MTSLSQLLRALPGGMLLVGTLLAQRPGSTRFAEMQWRSIGPFRGGRSVAVAGVPTQPGTFYMSQNNGGVWKTDDYGRTWNPIFDDQPTGSIGALAVASSDPSVIYVGSGEGLQRPDLSVGDGVYKSADAGRTWRHLGLDDAQQIASIIVDPKDPNRLFVAALGHPYGPSTQRGVYRSVDGGVTWERVLYKDENTGAVDLAFDPADPAIVYAVLWAGRQGPWEYGNGYEGPGSGLFKSTDGGTTWRKIGAGLPTVAQGLGRIGIGVAPSNGRRMYALVDTKVGGLFRSDDAGENWTRVNNEERIFGRGDDFAGVRVDPRDQDVVYVANTSMYRSADAGAHFTAMKGAPGGDDYHTIWLDPTDPRIILLGVDQGATISVNGGRTWSSWYNQPTAQMFHVAADNRFPYWVYGGQQESGSAGVASRSDDGEISFREWHPVGLEEYGYAAPDPLHPGIIYGGKVTRYDERTGQVQEVGPVPVRNGTHRFDRTAPLVFSEADPHLLFFGLEVLWTTRDGGQSWRQISPDLTRADPGIPASLGIYQNDAKGVHRGEIYAIAPSPRDTGVVWAGTDDGLIQVTTDGGRHWRDVTPRELTPWSKVTQLDASHFDTRSAYASVSRLRVDNLAPYIFRTHDGGKSWTKIVTGIPADEPVDVVRADPEKPGLLYAGTEKGVYVSFDDGDHWESLRLNLPATSVRDLVVHENDLAIATHGRGFWILDDVTPLRQAAALADAPAYLVRPAPAWRWRWNQNTDTPLPPEEPAGKNPPDGAILDYWLKTPASAGVTLEILDTHGRTVRHYASTDAPEPVDTVALAVPTYWLRPPQLLSSAAGMHRFVWDLHYPAPAALGPEYPIAAIYRDTPRFPRGPVVLPGRYTVRLTVEGHRYDQPLTVRMDPRVPTPALGLAAQFGMAMRIYQAIDRAHQAVAEVRSLRSQVAERTSHASAGTAEALAALDTALAALLTGHDALEPVIGDLAGVYGIVEGADATPTTQAVAAAAKIERELDGLLRRWADTRTARVAALNNLLRQAALPALDPSKLPGPDAKVPEAAHQDED
ncbi:MAG: WD40/YVTN/BNR-like repeat-containing protein [Gemmatimonadales bacterium]